MIVKLEKSPKTTKRYRVEMNNGNIYDFGLKYSLTYLDGADEETRINYRKRHYANEKERYLIDNLIPSPSLFSYYLIWGDTRNISENARRLNRKFYSKYGE